MATFFMDSQKRVRRIDDTTNISSKNLGLDSKSSTTSPEKVESLLDVKKNNYDKTSIDYMLKEAWDLGEQDKTRHLGVNSKESLGYNLSTELITNEPNPKFKVIPNKELLQPTGKHSLSDRRLDEGDAYRAMAMAFNKKHSFERTTNVVSEEDYRKRKYWIESYKYMSIKSDYETDYKTGQNTYSYSPEWSYSITLHKSKRNPKTSPEFFNDYNIDVKIEKLRNMAKAGKMSRMDIDRLVFIGNKIPEGNIAGAVADELQWMKDTRK